MTPLVPCPACKRHVATRELVCPFCTTALPRQRAKHVAVIGRVTRAAVFSAAVVACTNDKPAQPAPAPPPAKGSDDLEKLLDHQPVEPSRVAPAVDAQVADAPLADAGVPDAALPDAGVVKKKKKKDPANLEDVKIQQELHDQRHLAKPYGAPPARRRIV